MNKLDFRQAFEMRKVLEFSKIPQLFSSILLIRISVKDDVGLGEGHTFHFEASSCNTFQQASATELMYALGRT